MAKSSDRRTFLKQAAGLAGTASLGLPTLAADAVAAPTGSRRADALPRDADAYHTLAPDEAAFVEALVDVMCPADELTPSGVDCGLALGIDRLLASAWGRGEGRYLRGPFRQGKPQHGWQSPLTPEQLCKAGIAAARGVPAAARTRVRRARRPRPTGSCSRSRPASTKTTRRSRSRCGSTSWSIRCSRAPASPTPCTAATAARCSGR
jgi:hypothetical protein